MPEFSALPPAWTSLALLIDASARSFLQWGTDTRDRHQEGYQEEETRMKTARSCCQSSQPSHILTAGLSTVRSIDIQYCRQPDEFYIG